MVDYYCYWQLDLMFFEHFDRLGCETWFSWKSRHFPTFHNKKRWVWPENLYQQTQASYCGVVGYFSNVLLGNYAWINQNKVCLNSKFMAGFWLDWFWPENWLSKHWFNFDYLAACPQQRFQQVSEMILFVILSGDGIFVRGFAKYLATYFISISHHSLLFCYFICMNIVFSWMI